MKIILFGTILLILTCWYYSPKIENNVEMFYDFQRYGTRFR